MFKYDPATKECMGENLMIPDPYEFNHVLVKQSRMKGGGDGLFTKARMFKGDIIAFYNGVRSLSKEIVSSSFLSTLKGCPEIIASDKITAVKMAADIMQSGLNSIRS